MKKPSVLPSYYEYSSKYTCATVVGDSSLFINLFVKGTRARVIAELKAFAALLEEDLPKRQTRNRARRIGKKK